jgi:signal peptidase II
MLEPPRRSPLVPLARIATLVAIGDLMTKQVALLWVGTLEPRVSSAIQFGVVHNDKGAFGLSVGDYTFEISLALTLAALVLIVPVARDLAKIDSRAPAALGLVAGGAIGNLVSLLLSPAGVVDFIALQRADGAGIVLNVADVAAYAGVAMLMRTTAIVIAAIRRSREERVVEDAQQRTTAMSRLADLEVMRVVSRDDAPVADAEAKPAPGPSRPAADRQVHLRVLHADGFASRPGAGLAARLRDRDGGRSPSASAYLRPMSHLPETRGHR